MSTSPSTSLVPVSIAVINKAIALIRAGAERARNEGRQESIAIGMKHRAASYGLAKWYQFRKVTREEAEKLVDGKHGIDSLGDPRFDLIRWRYAGLGRDVLADRLESAAKLGASSPNAVIYLNLDDAQAVQSYL